MVNDFTSQPPASEAPQPVEPITLKWSTVMSDSHSANSDAIRNYVSTVEEKTRGKVKIDVYWNSALGNVKDSLKMVQSGIADGAYIVLPYHKDDLPLCAASGLPFLTTGYKIAPKAIKALYEEWPALQDEFKKAGVKPLYFTQSHEHYMGTNKPVAGLDDLNGLNIWGGGYWQNMLIELGASNFSFTTTEVYEALQKGVIDGFITTLVSINDKKFYEYARYMMRWPFGGAPANPMVISLEAWNKISPAYREIMTDEASKMPSWIAKQTDLELDDTLKSLKDKGVIFNELPETEITRGITLGKPAIYEPWLASCREKGIPCQEFLNLYTAKIKQFTN